MFRKEWAIDELFRYRNVLSSQRTWLCQSLHKLHKLSNSVGCIPVSEPHCRSQTRYYGHYIKLCLSSIKIFPWNNFVAWSTMLNILQAKLKKNAVELTLASDVIEKEDFRWIKYKKGSVSLIFFYPDVSFQITLEYSIKYLYHISQYIKGHTL